jgi:hypothetical protein
MELASSSQTGSIAREACIQNRDQPIIKEKIHKKPPEGLKCWKLRLLIAMKKPKQLLSETTTFRCLSVVFLYASQNVFATSSNIAFD